MNTPRAAPPRTSPRPSPPGEPSGSVRGGDAVTSEARRAALPSSAVPILERRGLAAGNPRLVQLLRRGMRVLDVGCGTGSITAEIAAAVAPEGSVVGLDRDASLIQTARERRRAANLTFDVGDVRGHRYDARFDLVTAARVLQWVAEPGTTLLAMVRAARPGGVLEVLDYRRPRRRGGYASARGRATRRRRVRCSDQAMGGRGRQPGAPDRTRRLSHRNRACGGGVGSPRLGARRGSAPGAAPRGGRGQAAGLTPPAIREPAAPVTGALPPSPPTPSGPSPR